jgi:hypothetical protein
VTADPNVSVGLTKGSSGEKAGSRNNRKRRFGEYII